MIPAARLSQTIVVSRETVTADATGGATRSFATFATFAAEVLPTGGRETVTAEVPRAEQGYKVTLRWSRRGLEVTPRDRVTWGAKTLNLRTAFEDPDGKRKVLVAFAESGVPV